LRRAEGGGKIFGVFRVKNHAFTPKNHIFPILGGSREIFGVFHVKKITILRQKNHIFTNFRGVALIKVEAHRSLYRSPGYLYIQYGQRHTVINHCDRHIVGDSEKD
jgi:hypothetical protein